MPSELFICLAPPFLFLKHFHFHLPNQFNDNSLNFSWVISDSLSSTLLSVTTYHLYSELANYICVKNHWLREKAKQNSCIKQVKLAQSCPTLCDPKDGRLPGSSVHGILKTRILKWVAIPLSRGSSQPRDQTQVSCIAGGFLTIWATWEAPLC